MWRGLVIGLLAANAAAQPIVGATEDSLPGERVVVLAPCRSTTWLSEKLAAEKIEATKRVFVAVSEDVTQGGYVADVQVGDDRRRYSGGTCDEVMEAAWVIVSVALASVPAPPAPAITLTPAPPPRPLTEVVESSKVRAVGLLGVWSGILPSVAPTVGARLEIGTQYIDVLIGGLWLLPQDLSYDTERQAAELSAFAVHAGLCLPSRISPCVTGELGLFMVDAPELNRFVSAAMGAVGLGAHYRHQWRGWNLGFEASALLHLARPTLETTPGRLIFEQDFIGLRVGLPRFSGHQRKGKMYGVKNAKEVEKEGASTASI